jgi:AmmeMemoRadiSam system protein B
MVRLPAVAGRFYPSDPVELSAQIRECLAAVSGAVNSSTVRKVKACMVPHAGLMFSGPVAGAVFSHIRVPDKVVILGVRHRPPGSPAAIISDGAFRTPLGDAKIDNQLAAKLRAACSVLTEDTVAHSKEHSLEVEIPFLQILNPDFRFVPIAVGTGNFETLVNIGEAIGAVLAAENDEVLLVTSSDLNHYEDDATTRVKDAKAIEQLLSMDARGLYDVCRNEEISMCGLGPAVAMLTALQVWKASNAELIRHATSADRSGDPYAVVGYAGMVFW